jgi:SOS-response transcriptional repressor LexA
VGEPEAGKLIASLRNQSDRYPTEMREIELSLVARELKRAFDMMSRLKERGFWRPDPEAAAALEDFWWESVAAGNGA